MTEIKRILIVDDEVLLCELMSSIFSMEGFEIKTAYDGMIAQKIFHDFKPELIISDIRMPNCDGYCLLEMVHKEGTSTPMVFMTGYGAGETDKLSKYPNVKKIYSKPLDIDELINFIKEIPIKNRILPEKNC
ncbi:MAG: response regulator [Bdellovibrio sp.]